MSRNVIVMGLLIAFMSNMAEAQQYAYEVTFTGKNGTPYSLSSPSVYLSARSLARRAAQGIAVDSSDLPVNPKYVDSVLLLTSGILHETSRWLDMCVVLLSDSAHIHNLDGKPFIRDTKLVACYSTYLHYKMAGSTGSPSPATPALKTGSADEIYYGLTWTQTNMMNGNYLYDQGLNGAGKLIAVLDAGFLGVDTHPGFDSMWYYGRMPDQHNFTLASDSVFAYDTHGTSVLSTMAGNAPNTFVGSAPSASYALYITEDNNSEQPIEMLNMLCATERADSLGADIITTSLGYNIFDLPFGSLNFSTDLDGKTTPAAQAANIATSKGMLFVATAGNEGGDSWNAILTPGDADSALTIGSVNIYGLNAGNSGYGPNAADQVKPDVCAMGVGAYVFTQTSYAAESGTSFATPQVAGWAACLWEANMSATPSRLRYAIIKCANHYTDPGDQIGYGIPNFQCTQAVLDVKDTPPSFSASHWIIATPNPFTDAVILAVSPGADDPVDFRITDLAGKTLTSINRYLNKGYNAPFSIPLAGLPPGIYILKAVSATQQQVIKLEKL